MKKWIAALLTLVMLSQALPWTAFAAMGDLITESELRRALSIAGLQYESAVSGGERALFAAMPKSAELPQLVAKESGYHPGMQPDETWDAQMLLDWLDDILKKEIYYVSSTYMNAQTILERMREEDPEQYAYFTDSEKWSPDYYNLCRALVLIMEDAKSKARFLRTRVTDQVLIIEQNTEALSVGADTLFDYEKIHLSIQIREATDALESLREDVLKYAAVQLLGIVMGKGLLEGIFNDLDHFPADLDIPQAFNEWIMSVLDSEDGMQEASVPSAAVMSAGYNTRMSRMRGETRLFAADSRDVHVMVVTENDFAVELHGVDNVPLEGVKVTVTDLNGKKVATRYTEDPRTGSAVFNANDFNCDYDKEMELSLEVDASAQGYRSFYIPWLLMKRGGVYRQTLTLLTGPEEKALYSAETGEANERQALFAASSSDFKPYVYACTFNGYDVLRQDKKTIISKVNDDKFNFELELAHPSGKEPREPVLHCRVERKNGRLAEIVEETFAPTSHVKVSSGRTKYVYTNTWKRDLAPDISKEQKPYFVLPDTGEVVRTTLQPVRSKIDKPIISGQETSNPLNSILGKGFALNVNIPVIGGKLTLDLPFDKYLPKINVDPTGYVTIMFGSSALKNPSDATLWKSKEAEAYDKSMKQYQHDMSVARKKQAAGTAKNYYKKFGASKPQTRIKFDFGYFMMFSGRWQSDDANGDSLWSVSGATGAEFVFSAEYTQMFSIGPVPFYVTATFTASMGLALDGLYFSFLVDKDMKVKNFEWSIVRGVTLNIRLMLSITFGVGLKGICSLWIRATGGLNLIVHILMKQPVHIAIYGEFFLSAGFELFWIKYSKEIWRSPYWKIYSNYELKSKAGFSLFTAYADEADADEAEKTPLEPTRYPALAPVAKEIMTNRENVQTGIKVVEFGGHTLIFYIGKAKDSGGNARRYIHYMDLATGKIDVPTRGPLPEELEDYDFDVMTNGNCIAIAACCAAEFDEDGFPRTGNIRCYTTIIASDYTDAEPDSDLACVGIFQNKLNLREVGYNGIDNPRIEAVHSDMKPYHVSFRVYGSCDAYYDVTKERGSIGFEVASEGAIANRMMLFSDRSVKSAFDDANERVVVRSDGRSSEAYSGSVLLSQFPSQGFIALSKPQGDEPGEGGIELFDFEMNAASARSSIVNGRRTYTDSKRRAIALVRGDIDHIEVVQTISPDRKNSARTVFYSQLETKGELTEKRLRSVCVAPRQGDSKDFSYDVTYTDYDVNMPADDFRVVTLGASQYLYWLSTVSKNNESDPDLWRISGMYYDAATGAMSDQIVIAEFSLPDAEWKGKKWRSVPFEIMLTESGVGYITARPETGSEKDSAIAPMTLYSFPITLKPVMDMRSATLMETTVSQGEMISTDFSMMNEGNMGIGSFDIEMYMMKGDKEGKKIETLHADCLYPDNSTLVLHEADGPQTVAKGEQAFYRLKDFEYTPRQNEWIVKNQSGTITVKNATEVSTSEGTDKFDHIATNVLVPGALGGYTGMIKIPIDWKGSYDLRLKLTNVSTYSNWLAAAALAKSRPELFAESAAQGGALFAANTADDTLAELGIQKLVYTLDEGSGKLVLQQPKALFAAKSNGGDESVFLYATEIEAPEPIEINCDVHDIDVGHRVWADYYGEEMLDIIISNYYITQEAIELNCAVYLDNSDTPRYISLPYDPNFLSAGKTTTITLPLKTFIPDADQYREARVVITGRGIAETALVNNEFTLYLGGSGALTISEQPQSQTVPVGGSAAFTVGVSGGKAPYKYQWQVFADGKWQDIPGANEATLTLDKVKAGWNGRKTHCIITDADDTAIISDEAVLMINGQGTGEDDEGPDTGDHMSLPLYLTIALMAAALLLLLRRRERD